MTLVKDEIQLIDQKKISNPTKDGMRVITHMPTSKIISFVAYRHRVGLLMASTVFMAGYIAYDKVVKLFV